MRICIDGNLKCISADIGIAETAKHENIESLKFILRDNVTRTTEIEIIIPTCLSNALGLYPVVGQYYSIDIIPSERNGSS